MGIMDEVDSLSEDDGLWYPADYILPRWAVWRLSGYTAYPGGGAYDDQPRRLLEDFQMLQSRFTYHLQAVKPKGGAW